jgi:hypothetical protein
MIPFSNHGKRSQTGFAGLLAVETNISTVDMSGKGDSSGRRGYSFSIGELYFLGDDDLSPPPESREWQGDDLISPRKNKKAGLIATFSDDDS